MEPPEHCVGGALNMFPFWNDIAGKTKGLGVVPSKRMSIGSALAAPQLCFFLIAQVDEISLYLPLCLLVQELG